MKKTLYAFLSCILLFSCKHGNVSFRYEPVVLGQCADKENFYITPHDVTYDTGVLQILDYKGNLEKEIQLPGYAYSFKKLEYPDGTIRYSYLQVICKSKYPGGIYEDTNLVLMDEQFKIVKDKIHPVKSTIIPDDNWPLENHDYEVLGDNHFILMTVVPTTVTNIPGYTGKGYNLYNCVIQEQKDGNVIWEFQTIDYPELYSLSHNYNNTSWNWNDAKYQSGSENYNDYIHFNSLSYDSEKDAYLISYRGLGLIKVDRKTKKIIWTLSSMQNKGVETPYNVDVTKYDQQDVFGYFQHDVSYLSDGSFTIFDNHIVGPILDAEANGNCRILRYKIDDETKSLTSFTEYVCPMKYSYFMGAAKLLDEENETYLINYGGNISTPAFEIYSFKNKESLMKMSYSGGYDLYNAGHGTEKTIQLPE